MFSHPLLCDWLNALGPLHKMEYYAAIQNEDNFYEEKQFYFQVVLVNGKTKYNIVSTVCSFLPKKNREIGKIYE